MAETGEVKTPTFWLYTLKSQFPEVTHLLHTGLLRVGSLVDHSYFIILNKVCVCSSLVHFLSDAINCPHKCHESQCHSGKSFIHQHLINIK